MKKSITFGTIAIACVLFFALAFKSADNDKKDYVVIYYNTVREIVSLSFSNGTYQKLDYLKRQGNGDQTQILKLINELEGQGYKLVTYDSKLFTPNAEYDVATALLSK